MKILILFFFLVYLTPAIGQQHDSVPGDSGVRMSQEMDAGRNTSGLPAMDSLSAGENYADSLMPEMAGAVVPDSRWMNPKKDETSRILLENWFVNTGSSATYLDGELRVWNNQKEVLFYMLCGLLLILGLFRKYYGHYLTNLFSVFFNTTLRQTQLAEQLAQAKLPSLVLNIYFVLVMGAFVWLSLLHHLQELPLHRFVLLQLCLIAIASIYLIKYFFLKFVGWITGYRESLNRYIFIIFLVNKLLSIILVPFLVLLALGKSEWVGVCVTLGFLSIAVLLLSRYLKSYRLLRQGFLVSTFHFFLFFVGAELLPFLIMYKVVDGYLIA